MSTTKIVVHLKASCESIRPVVVTSTQQIEILQQLFPSGKKIFLYKGHPLSESMSFEFYGLKDKDVIVAVSKSDPSFQSYISLISKMNGIDKKAVIDAIKYSTNSDTAAEYARIRDLQLSKFENYHERKLLKVLQDTSFNTSCPRTSKIQPISYKSQTFITSEPLPIFWTNN